MTRPARSRRSGVTLVEVIVSSAIAVAILLVVTEIVQTTTRAQTYVAARDRAQSRASLVVADLRAAGFASRRVYQDDAVGRAYLAALDAAGYAVMSGARLPVVDAAGRLEPDGGDLSRTGNAVLFACEDPPQDVTPASGHVRRVDVVRFFGIFPTRVAGRVTQSLADRIDLVRFSSRPYADRASLDAITDLADRADAIHALRAQGIDRAWLAGAAIGAAFFDLRIDGTISPTPVASPTITCLPDALPTLVLGDGRMTVAPNDAKLSVPSFAAADAAEPSYPSGFEVKIVGPSGGRQILVRLVVVAGANRDFDAVAQTTRIFAVRDL